MKEYEQKSKESKCKTSHKRYFHIKNYCQDRSYAVLNYRLRKKKKKYIYTHLFHSNVPYKIELPTIISFNTRISRGKSKMTNYLCTMRTNFAAGSVAIGQLGKVFFNWQRDGLDDTGKRCPASKLQGLSFCTAVYPFLSVLSMN